MIECPKCGLVAEPSKMDPHICDDCRKQEANLISYHRGANVDWMEISKEAGLELWERQPAETDREYQIWLAYRDAYPSIRPSYRQVAEQLLTTVQAVRHVGRRWKFATRLRAWAAHCDEITMQQRTEEILTMNKKHVDMASKVAEKLKIAIDNIDPYGMSAKDIQGLMKLSTDIERTARLDAPAANVMKLFDEDEDPNLKKSPTKSGDLTEILDILGKAGVLNEGKKIGVRQTTEVVLEDD